MISLDRKAFTLIELLIVVAIIAILAAIAVPNFLEAQVRAKVSRARNDLRTVTTALESYAVDFNKYPPEMQPHSATGPIWGYKQLDRGRDGHGNPRVGPFQTVSISLTTPVSYLSSVMPDVFKQGRTAAPGREGMSIPYWIGGSNGRAFDSGNPFDAAYMYQNIAMRAALGGTDYTQEDIRDYGNWRLFSLGPMGLVWPIGTGDRTMGWKYDATNGTMSSGYIIRTQKDTSGENFSRS